MDDKAEIERLLEVLITAREAMLWVENQTIGMGTPEGDFVTIHVKCQDWNRNVVPALNKVLSIVPVD